MGAIKSFADKETEKIFNQEFSRKLPPDIQDTALDKLVMIDLAENINDLRSPPSNHLEQLQGKRQGQYSIRINRQYRICFDVRNNCFFNVEIIDYH